MKKILIADDEPGVRHLVKTALSADDYEILEAHDGVDALRIAREARPDMILLDVMMPGLSGFEVCHSLKSDAETSDITIVMLTARAREADRRRSIEVGADSHVAKPFSPLALMQKVDEIFDNRAAF